MRLINDQRHAVSCGPVAISNALKWLGISPNAYDLIHAHCMNHKYKPWAGGMPHDGLSAALRGLSVKFQHVVHPTVSDIEQILDQGKCCILGYRYWRNRECRGHYLFITGHSQKRFKISNGHFATYRGKKTDRIVKEKDVFRRCFHQSKQSHNLYPSIWVFSKEL